ncbi:MAG: hypothetical protein KDK45_03440, partial [Leptospiraceae bacterium]|nr:hypothetical protein [Leptospiraceae bacterium]
LYSQSKTDFHDPYDYNLRRYKSGIEDSDYYKEYELPPKYPKPSLVNPKSVIKPSTPFTVLPGFTPGAFNVNINSRNAPKINPVTGEVISTSESKKKKTESKNLEKYLKEKKYTETPERRTEIIFFLTFPFALVITGGLIYIAGTFAGQDWIRTTAGAGTTLLGAAGISYWNVLEDRQKLEDFRKKEKLGISHPASNLIYSSSQFIPRIEVFMPVKRF